MARHLSGLAGRASRGEKNGARPIAKISQIKLAIAYVFSHIETLGEAYPHIQ